MRTDHAGIRDLSQGGAGFVKTQNNLWKRKLSCTGEAGFTKIRAQDADFFPLCQEFGKSRALAAKAKSNRRA